MGREQSDSLCHKRCHCADVPTLRCLCANKVIRKSTEMLQNTLAIIAISHPALSVNPPKKRETGDITAQFWRRYFCFNGLPEPTESCQLSKSEKEAWGRGRGVGYARKNTPAILVSAHSS